MRIVNAVYLCPALCGTTYALPADAFSCARFTRTEQVPSSPKAKMVRAVNWRIQLCWASKAAMHPPAETFFYKKVCEKFACGQKFSLRKIYEKISRINFAKKIRRRIRFAASGIEGFNSLAQLFSFFQSTYE